MGLMYKSISTSSAYSLTLFCTQVEGHLYTLGTIKGLILFLEAHPKKYKGNITFTLSNVTCWDLSVRNT